MEVENWYKKLVYQGDLVNWDKSSLYNYESTQMQGFRLSNAFCYNTQKVMLSMYLESNVVKEEKNEQS